MFVPVNTALRVRVTVLPEIATVLTVFVVVLLLTTNAPAKGIALGSALSASLKVSMTTVVEVLVAAAIVGTALSILTTLSAENALLTLPATSVALAAKV